MLAFVLHTFVQNTYYVVLYSVNLWVGDVALDATLVEVMCDFSDLQNTNLVESPASNLLGKSLICCLDLLCLRAWASNQASSSISAEPMTVTRAEFLACMVVTRDNCAPTAKGSSEPATSSLVLYAYAVLGALSIGANNGLLLPKVCPIPRGKAMTSKFLSSPPKKFLISGRRTSGRGVRTTSWVSAELIVS
jgi:hypothetical protein